MHLACFHKFMLHDDLKRWALCPIPGICKIFLVFMMDSSDFL